MANLFNYVKRNADKDYNELPFNELDSLLLCALTYLNFEKYPEMIEKNLYPFSELHSKNDIKILTKETFLFFQSKRMLKKIFKAKRYENLKVGNVDVKNDLNTGIQFAAMTFEICDGIYYIAFRGTDTSIAGIKEDLNLAILDNIPSQKEAVLYINNVYENYEGSYYVGGHSKGGNIALYGAMHSLDDFKKQLLMVYNFDGPGFKSNIFNSPEYEKIKYKVIKVIPYSDVVGILLNNNNDFMITRSGSIGILQHNMYAWKIKGDTFSYISKTSYFSKIVDKSVFEWLNLLTDKQKEEIVRIIFQVLDQSKINNFFDFKKETIKKIMAVFSAVGNIDSDDKKEMLKLTKLMIKVYVGNFFRIFCFK